MHLKIPTQLSASYIYITRYTELSRLRIKSKLLSEHLIEVNKSSNKKERARRSTISARFHEFLTALTISTPTFSHTK